MDHEHDAKHLKGAATSAQRSARTAGELVVRRDGLTILLLGMSIDLLDGLAPCPA